MDHNPPVTADENAPHSPSFTHLHVHSEYSLLDSTIRIKELVKRAKKQGYTHIALTDHGNMHGAVELYSAAKGEGLTPIIGCEVYHSGSPETLAVAEECKDAFPHSGAFHLVLLARDTTGYHNLLRLVSSGYVGEHFRDVPIVPASALQEHGGQLVALSSCQRGELGYLVGKLREFSGEEGPLLFTSADSRIVAVMTALRAHKERMEAYFGQGEYYAELIDNNLPVQKQLLPDLVAVAKHLGLPLVASADAHYLDEAFAETHALAIAIKNSLTLSDIRGRLQNCQFHLRTPAEMEVLFAAWPEALANTNVIAEKCSGVAIKMDTYFLPKIDLGTGEGAPEALERIAREGLHERFKVLTPLYGPSFNEERQKEYWDRLEYELGVINQMGFPDYFLIVQDFINWAKQNGIPVGPGRGSGAGSLVAYALRITDLDPIPYNLIFERFLNPERVSMPDFDVDFCQWRREEVIQYCIRKYGSRNVAQITTFGKMQAKGAVKSVGRAMNLGYTRVDQFTKLFPPDLGMTLQMALEQEPRLKQAMAQDDGLRECMESALKLEGLASHTSVHAAGLVISDGEMTNYVPIYTTDGQSYITQYEMKPTEKVGLVKFDFLGLKTLTVINKAAQLIRQGLNPQFDIETIPLDDHKVYRMISDGHTCGIFQCESSGMTQLILKLKPSTFEDVIALVALFRPGPLGSGMVDDFVERKHGRQKISYPHPQLEPILKDTYGMILYQEQVQKIAAVLANYSLGEADLLRRAMGKKIPEEMAKQKDRFLSGASQNSIDPTLAEEIFDLMAEFAKYGFNKSHSAAYGLVSYQTAFLKAHYPEQFLAASMTCDLDNTDKIVRYVEDCRRLQFTVLPPRINRSLLEFDVPGKAQVGFALAAIKGVGEAVLEPLIAERDKNGPFGSLTELAQRVNLARVGKKTMQLLAAAGALDDFGYSRKVLDGILPEVVAYSLKHHEAQSMGQRSLFDLGGEEDVAESRRAHAGAPWEGAQVPCLPADVRPWEMDDLFAEKKLLGMFLSGHPMEFYQTDATKFSNMTLQALSRQLAAPPPAGGGKGHKVKVVLVALLTAMQYRRTKKGSLMAYARLEDPGFSYEAVLFEDLLQSTKLPPIDSAVVVYGVVEAGFDGSHMRFNLERLQPLEEVRQERVKGVVVKVGEPKAQAAHELAQELKTLFESSRGPTPTRLHLDLGATEVLIDTSHYRVELSDRFVCELNHLLQGHDRLNYALH